MVLVFLHCQKQDGLHALGLQRIPLLEVLLTSPLLVHMVHLVYTFHLVHMVHLVPAVVSLILVLSPHW